MTDDPTQTSGSEFQKDNHYVPRLYLKRWANDDKAVNTYRILVPHQNVHLWKRQSTKGLAYHEHLYTRAMASGETDEVEKWLARDFEEPAEVPLQKVVSRARLSREDWQCLIRFAAAQDVRTPARMLEMMRRWHSAEMGGCFQGILESSVNEYADAMRQGRSIQRTPSPGTEYFPGRVTTGIEPGAEEGFVRAEMITGRAYWLFAIRRLLNTTINTLLEHRWTILCPPRHMRWLTSDDPFVKLNFHSAATYDFKGGWGSPGTEILLPLDPGHMLYTKIGERRLWERNVQVPEDTALGFQKFTSEHAHRLIFAVDDDPLVQRLRPRTVDAVAFRHEQEQWARWNKQQGEAERHVYGAAR